MNTTILIINNRKRNNKQIIENNSMIYYTNNFKPKDLQNESFGNNTVISIHIKRRRKQICEIQVEFLSQAANTP